MSYPTLIRWLSIVLLAVVALPRGAAAAEPTVATLFSDYYNGQDGMRVLGHPLNGLEIANGFHAQYFEKGRLEYHPEFQDNDRWLFAYGRLAAELIERGANLPVGGDTSSLSYADLRAEAAPERRVAPPRPNVDGPIDAGLRGTFVPTDPQLKSGPGHFVPRRFWAYANRADLFPGGWLHDLGLPLTAAISARVTKGGVEREIIIQAFERTILTDDPLNQDVFQIERANVGRDYLAATPLDGEDVAIIDLIDDTDYGVEVTSYIQFVDGPYARVWLLPHNTADFAVDPAWVFLHKGADGWKIVGGPGTDFSWDFYTSLGIPATMHVGSELERSLHAAVQEHVKSTPVGDDLTTEFHRLAAGVALVRVWVGETDLGFVYARLEDVNRWRILGGPATSFEPAFYEENAIPRLLRLADLVKVSP